MRVSSFRSRPVSTLLTVLVLSLSAMAKDNPVPSSKPGAPAEACETGMTPGVGAPPQDRTLQVGEEGVVVSDVALALRSESVGVALQRPSTNLAQIKLFRAEEAQKIAARLFEVVVDRKYLDSEQGRLELNAILSGIGSLQGGSMKSINAILDVSIGEVKEPEKVQYKADAKNSLSELTRVMTEYRKGGMDVHRIRKWFMKVTRRDIGAYLVEKFETIVGAIKNIEDTMLQAIGGLSKRNIELARARQEANDLFVYAEVSLMVCDELERLLTEYRETNLLADKEAADTFSREFLEPLATRKRYITEEQMSLLTAYNQFRVLMEGNLDLITILRNLRATAGIDLRVNSVANLVGLEQQRTIEQAQNVRAALRDIRQESIDRMKKNGVAIREFKAAEVREAEGQIAFLDQTLAELDLALSFDATMYADLQRVTELTRAKIAEVQKRGGDTDLLTLADAIGDGVGRRDQSQLTRDLARVPNVPATAAAPADTVAGNP